jgi:dTDP-4-dehydrorhamnose reductase
MALLRWIFRGSSWPQKDGITLELPRWWHRTELNHLAVDYSDHVKVVITGASGLLGTHLISEAPSGTQIFTLSRRPLTHSNSSVIGSRLLDLLQSRELTDVLDAWMPDAVIHAAAEGSVDAVEGRLSTFRPLNVEVPRQIAAWCQRHGRKFAFISSNAVFGGGLDPIGDDALPSPINDYGRLKTEAERAVQDESPDVFIPRPILMYGWPSAGGRSNPAVWWVSELRNGSQIRVVNDVISEPIGAWDVARGIWSGVEQGVRGAVNLSSGCAVTLHEFAETTARAFDLDFDLVSAVSSSEFPGLAPRPAITKFTGERMRKDLGLRPSELSVGLAELVKREVRHNVE